ncbi:hypothetical protein JRI60_20140 [Archangium violaceum]|uniref:hypothetical protein n=1 Tax=Archangium violaceum TaxID=83451 RepID=UPI0019522458|nr:hypothetical protein [Archangium violaceum]QRO01171.1 hypothetical protein JRI60_20140 [Archangium violaceum]
MVRKLTAAAALATLAVSCAPETQTPVKVRALVRSSDGQYAPLEVELKTVTDIVALEGTVIRFQGGANIRLDSRDPEAQAATTDEALERALVKEEGHRVTASYIADEAGVLWPADFHTWNLVTTYYNFERAWDYFTTTAEVKKEELPQTTVYYFPEFVLADSSEKPQRDNALFFAPTRSFMVLPFETVQKAPLAINASILTHEYAHLVFNRRVYDGRGIPEPIAAWTIGGGSPTPGLNVIKSLDEGLADFHAYVASCRSSFGCNTRVLDSSFEGRPVEDRDLSQNWCMSKELRDLMFSGNFSVFSGREYQVGTILASALVKASGSDADRQVLARAVAAAYSDTNPLKYGLNQLARNALNRQEDFSLGAAARSIVQHIPAGNVDLKQRVCTRLVTHLQLSIEELSAGQDACPQSTTTSDACPPIAQ